MHHLTAIGSGDDDTTVVVELGDSAADVGVVTGNGDGCADDWYQLAPVRLVGSGVVLELLVDAVKGVELGHEDVGAADWLGGPFVDGATIAGQIDGITEVSGMGVDVDTPADADGIDVVRHDAGFTQYSG